MHEPLTNVRPVIFLNFAAGTPKTEVWRGLHGAATLQAQCGKIVIAVGEDIDPTNTDAVFWSLAYRTNLGEDLHVAPYKDGGHGPKSGPRGSDSALLIDATPKHPMPPFALPAREFMERAKVIWDELGLPQLNPQPPWYGYSLGDWTDNWDNWAKRAVEGRWEETGRETFAGRKGGMIPETPVRSVTGQGKEGIAYGGGVGLRSRAGGPLVPPSPRGGRFPEGAGSFELFRREFRPRALVLRNFLHQFAHDRIAERVVILHRDDEGARPADHACTEILIEVRFDRENGKPVDADAHLHRLVARLLGGAAEIVRAVAGNVDHSPLRPIGARIQHQHGEIDGAGQRGPAAEDLPRRCRDQRRHGLAPSADP